MSIQFVSGTSAKALATAVAIATLAFAPFTSYAAPLVVTPSENQGWEDSSSDGATVSFVADETASGDGALQLVTAATNESRAHYSLEVDDVRLTDATDISYSTKQVSVPAVAQTYGNATLRITLDLDGEAGSEEDQLMYEPYYNGFGGSTNWVTYDISSSNGKFWSNSDTPRTYNGSAPAQNAGGYDTNFTLGDVLHDFPEAVVTEIVVSMGTWNPDQTILVDEVEFNGTTYDFEQDPPVPFATNTTSGEEYTDLGEAVGEALDGETILIEAGTHTVPAGTITISKDITIIGEENAVLQTSGSDVLFRISANGVTIENLTIEKTDDNVSQNIISIQGSDASIVHNHFKGRFNIGDSETTRALEVSTTNGLLVDSNIFENLRQPAYVNDNTVGTISNNYTTDTKGWVVVSNSNLTFTDNTWGTNVVDIAIIAGGSDNYTDILAMSGNNDGAVIINKFAPVRQTEAWVNASAPNDNDDGSSIVPLKTLGAAMSRIVNGGTIHLMSDITLSSQLNVNKSVTIEGNDHQVTADFSGGSVVQIITANNVTINDLVVDGGGAGKNNRGINAYVVTGVLLDGVTVQNNNKNGLVVNGSTVVVNNITTDGNGWEAIDVDMGGGVTTQAHLTVNGVSVHLNSAKAAIRIDNVTKSPTPTVVDTNDQYTITETSEIIRDYFPKNENTETEEEFEETTTSGDVQVDIYLPEGTIVTADADWDGIINAPIATTTTVTVDGAETVVTAAITVGSDLYTLYFDQAAKITFEGQVNTRAGWINHAGVFTEITTVCDANTQESADSQLGTGEDCKIDVGDDLVVWTKHFSTFMTYTQTSTSSGGNGGGGSSSNNDDDDNESTATDGSVDAGGEVLGAATFAFTTDMTIGSTGEAVIELQKILIAAGHLQIAAPTGYFGELTKAALVKWQVAHGVPGTGYFGPLTRAAINAAAPMESTETQQKVIELMQQLIKLLQELRDMKNS